MKVAIIGRSEIMYETTLLLLDRGFKIPIIITSNEAPEYTKTANDFRLLATQIGALFIKTGKINSMEVMTSIKEVGADIACSINYSGIIPQNVIDLFPLGILNAHGGDLPRYRGNACQAWAIINGAKEIGLTIYKMKGDYLDGGKVINKYFLPIDISTTVTQCWSWLANQVPAAFLDACLILEKDGSYFTEDSTLSKIEPMRCYPRKPEDGKISWSKTNEEIVRLINASCEPYSGAFCEFENDKLIIWKAIMAKDDENYLAIPGQVAEINSETIVVITGRGKIELEEIEYNGYRGHPAEIIKSIRKRLN